MSFQLSCHFCQGNNVTGRVISHIKAILHKKECYLTEHHHDSGSAVGMKPQAEQQYNNTFLMQYIKVRNNYYNYFRLNTFLFCQ